MGEKPLRRTRTDLILTAAFTAAAIVGVTTVWVTAPARDAHLSTASETFVAGPGIEVVPQSLTQAWTVTDTAPGNHKPLTAGGVVIAADGPTVSGYTPGGDLLWSYEREDDLCALMSGFESAVAVYRTGVGCGDVVEIRAATGEYGATRSAIASETVAPISSNDRVGILGSERVELWRSDLVRTVEYGDVEAKQEAAQQPHEDCSVTSAMTRKELLAVVDDCADGYHLRLQNTTPEDSREPEISRDIAIDGVNARLVAVGQEAAAVYVENPEPMIVSYDSQGEQTSSRSVDGVDFPAPPFQPATADLPHHMSWFDGGHLTLFTPSRLGVATRFDDALGTGIAVGGRLLYPVAGGIAVADWDSGEVLRTLAVDRGNYSGPVSLALAGGTIVEKRGGTLVGLTQ
ncbi:hypothetical protein [Corynebacterium pacaense]|uniref:Rv3212 family protein n=1 Tax=Corynebacterium pacaense TaxID=1816684 RepID=UPI0009BA14AB|nr:hypothetical protein [Corynebacterium pacaense]